MNVAVIFDNFGPYHLARLRAAAKVCDLTAVEVASSSAEYKWKREENAETLKTEMLNVDGGGRKAEKLGGDVSISAFKSITLFQQNTSREIPRGELVRKLNEALNGCRPQVIFVPGWSSRAAFAALRWCVQNEVPAVAMSESTEWDEKRSRWKEWVKRRLVGLFSSALVGGNPHKNYMVKLGMPPEQIFLGYDAVDNEYFKEKTEMLKAENLKSEAERKLGLPENYFLASARFIGKKNLSRLLEAYACYRELAERSGFGNRSSEIWNLVLLGDGALRSSILRRRSLLGLDASVHLPGFKQYPELPAYYALAGAFIHASTTEQWGLVVNEAMASGLPVLVSNRCGCAADLVQEGVNGFTFDPRNVEQLAELMFKFSNLNSQLATFGSASARIISDWGTNRFAGALKQAAECALRKRRRRASWIQKLVLGILLCVT